MELPDKEVVVMGCENCGWDAEFAQLKGNRAPLALLEEAEDERHLEQLQREADADSHAPQRKADEEGWYILSNVEEAVLDQCYGDCEVLEEAERGNIFGDFRVREHVTEYDRFEVEL